MIDWLVRDPLRGIFSFDKFPYEIGEDELEVDFMVKAALYFWILIISAFFFLEGGFVTYLLWVLVNGVRRNK